eukprot:CAMPEP_0115174858 /NCGR_PEP_ID=MMETSP0270-20121206/4056_1 /TAXON_ID=71861 /ORGANISM="Scrippsiella trochoidea, Strain CCMP3099" /LENGTH=233 /DNA_ID=CAMNT_0002587711 /DNA_START=725 /DNA_END=1425 /DNA_ORIENTATION=+
MLMAEIGRLRNQARLSDLHRSNNQGRGLPMRLQDYNKWSRKPGVASVRWMDACLHCLAVAATHLQDHPWHRQSCSPAAALGMEVQSWALTGVWFSPDQRPPWLAALLPPPPPPPRAMAPPLPPPRLRRGEALRARCRVELWRPRAEASVACGEGGPSLGAVVVWWGMPGERRADNWRTPAQADDGRDLRGGARFQCCRGSEGGHGCTGGCGAELLPETRPLAGRDLCKSVRKK